jgi:hypothetical protein
LSAVSGSSVRLIYDPTIVEPERGEAFLPGKVVAGEGCLGLSFLPEGFILEDTIPLRAPRLCGVDSLPIWLKNGAIVWLDKKEACEQFGDASGFPSHASTALEEAVDAILQSTSCFPFYRIQRITNLFSRVIICHNRNTEVINYSERISQAASQDSGDGQVVRRRYRSRTPQLSDPDMRYFMPIEFGCSSQGHLPVLYKEEPGLERCHKKVLRGHHKSRQPFFQALCSAGERILDGGSGPQRFDDAVAPIRKSFAFTHKSSESPEELCKMLQMTIEENGSFDSGSRADNELIDIPQSSDASPESCTSPDSPPIILLPFGDDSGRATPNSELLRLDWTDSNCGNRFTPDSGFANGTNTPVPFFSSTVRSDAQLPTPEASPPRPSKAGRSPRSALPSSYIQRMARVFDSVLSPSERLSSDLTTS